MYHWKGFCEILFCLSKSSITLSIKSRQGNWTREDSIAMETNGFSGGRQCVFTPANENSYEPSALGSYVWTATEVVISCALYLHVPTGHEGI